MNWNSISELVAMGGYGVYVWGSFGVVLASMAAEVAMVGQRWRTVRDQLRRAAARTKAHR